MKTKEKKMNTYKTKPIPELDIEKLVDGTIRWSTIHEEVEGKSITHTLFKDFNTTMFGMPVTLSAHYLGSIHSSHIYGNSIEESLKALYHFRRNSINPEYFDAYTREQTTKRKNVLERTVKLEEELRIVCADDKSIIKKIDELSGLLVCEAEGYLLKIQDRIYKKATPKAIHQYTALMKLRKQPVITCE